MTIDDSIARVLEVLPRTTVVRQLPMFLQVYMIDVMFALFTDTSQRAFELLSKTRVVASPNSSESI